MSSERGGGKRVGGVSRVLMAAGVKVFAEVSQSLQTHVSSVNRPTHKHCSN